MLARAARRAPRRTRAARSRRSGCSGSRSRRARARPRRRTRRGRAASRVSSRSGTVTTSAPGKERAALVHRVGGSGTATRRRSPSATCANEKIASFEPSVGTISRPGSTSTPKRRRSSRRSPRAARAGRPRAGRTRRSSSPATSASRMNAGVGSRGSPTPKSISVEAARARLGPPRRRAARTGTDRARRGRGESCTLRRCREEALQRGEGALELGDLDALVDGVRVPGRAGAEVDGVEPAGGEVGDVRPRLLRLDREPADLAQPLDERRARARRGRRGECCDDLELAPDELAQPRLRLRRACGSGRSGS